MSFKRVNGRLVEALKPVLKDGHQLAVLRPLTEEAARTAIEKAKALAAESSVDHEAFNRIVSDQEQMMFVGLLGPNATVLDPETNAQIDTCQPGDSFVRAEDLSKFERIADA